MLPTFRRYLLSSTLLVLLTATLGSVARADIVYLKDGTVLYGKVIGTRETFTDPATGQVIDVPRGDGVYGVYDGTRLVTFSRLQLDPNRVPEDTDIYAGLLRL